jgi:hypothetical protein
VSQLNRACKFAGLATLAVAFAASAQDSPAPVTGLQSEVVFTEYSPLSRSVELARRTLTPLTNVELARASVTSGLRPQAIDLNQETFAVYVPVKRPPQGYGLLVFIPPQQTANLPGGWASVLDEQDMIFVSASKSGNDESVLDRRIPLALLGAYNIMQRYPIDKDRVYVGGFSGGSRVALRTALAYPDLFRGALLNAGSDNIGSVAIVPPEELFQQFQSSSRLVYVTGTLDKSSTDRDKDSQVSMHEWCVFGTSMETMLGSGHTIADPASLHRALATLDKTSPIDADKLSACRARIAKELAAKLQHVSELLDRDKPHDAWESLIKIGIRYGGLATPESIALEQRIGSRR